MSSDQGKTSDPMLLSQARELLSSIAAIRPSDFTGVGILFYIDLKSLPHLQLSSEQPDPRTSDFDARDIAQLLTEISTPSCPLHDGFHFVEAASWRLTHLSQFISPSIPPSASKRFHGTGARFMAAALASLLPGVCGVGLVSQAGDLQLFCNGADTYNEK